MSNYLEGLKRCTGCTSATGLCERCKSIRAAARAEGAAQEREACAKVAERTGVANKYCVGNRPFLDTKEAVAQDEMRVAVAADIRARGATPKCAGCGGTRTIWGQDRYGSQVLRACPECTPKGLPAMLGALPDLVECTTCTGTREVGDVTDFGLRFRKPCPDCAPKGLPAMAPQDLKLDARDLALKALWAFNYNPGNTDREYFCAGCDMPDSERHLDKGHDKDCTLARAAIAAIEDM